MATAARKAPSTLGGAGTKAEPTPSTGVLQFEIYQENSGNHRWRLISSDGRPLATSCESFASRVDAQRSVDKSR
jgi:uncharacterized protein YegP (UPF0339 family)